ncbi:flavin-containing monooxygenase [Aspergillus carlsbadensis]|nr:flavin-containing monooxygenase [Aspergillus carlsbadensis]
MKWSYISRSHPAHRSPFSAPDEDLARSIVDDWLNQLKSLLTEFKYDAVRTLFREDAWLRDLLTFSWDLRTITGRHQILDFLAEGLETRTLIKLESRADGYFAPTLKRISPTLHWIESMFDFQTSVGRGSGVVRLVPAGNGDGRWVAYAVNFTLQELNEAPESAYENRPYGEHGTSTAESWYQKRARELTMLDDPEVIIVGAGQAGLSLAARLRALGVSHLIIDSAQRVGDSWRQRYRTLVMHDPIQYRHMPFVPFPPTWPTFTPKDKMADFFEAYVNLMELNVWMNSTVLRAAFDETTQTWAVEVNRDNTKPRMLHPRHVVLATGLAADGIIPNIPFRDTFEGTIYHASTHQDASTIPNVQNKKVVIVGSGNSGHDICEDFYQYGADVSMIQRGGTYVTRDGLSILNNLYGEGGPPIDDTDLYSHSLPLPVQFALSVLTTQQIAKKETDLLTKLSKAGFKLDFCEDGSGMIRKWLTRGGGYYVDRGGSQLIIDGKVKLHQCADGISQFTPRGMLLRNGTEVEADIVVFATGYDKMKSTARKIFGAHVADRLQEEWDLDQQGEINAMWRPSGHPNFWYMGGTFGWCRSFSRILALQIKAALDGIYAGIGKANVQTILLEPHEWKPALGLC